MIVVPAAADPRVSVIVVAARGPERLLRCLDAVAREAPPDLPLEVVLVLNAAEPALPDALRDVRGAHVVVSEISLGFAGGVNLGGRHARGELLHVLHDDAIVSPAWLDALIAALDERPEVGAAGSLVLNPDGSVQSAGHVLWRDGRTSAAWRGPAPDPASFRDTRPVDYCASASLLIRRAAWDAVGGLDEELHPAYYVDVDLAMALRSRGYVVVCAPASRVHHERGGSSRDALRTFLTARNRERIVAKWTADLAHQEPYGEDEAALVRAGAATARRARELAAGAPAPVVSGSRPDPAPETELERLRREHRQLRRDIEVKDAYIRELEARWAELEDRLAEAGRTRERLEADGATAQRALAEIHATHAALHEEHRQLHARLTAEEAEIRRLGERDRALAAIEAGGWWRLRARLLPVLRLASRLRRRLSRRAGTSRTG